jgi:hypothetical protein
MSPNTSPNAPLHAEHWVSPGRSRANFLHFSHRVRVTPLAGTPGAGSTLSTVYSRWVGSTEAEQVGSQGPLLCLRDTLGRNRSCAITTRRRRVFPECLFRNLGYESIGLRSCFPRIRRPSGCHAKSHIPR